MSAVSHRRAAYLSQALAKLCFMALCLGWLGQGIARADDARFTFPKELTISPKGVNLQTGRFGFNKVDLKIGNLKFARSWGDLPTLTFASHSIGSVLSYSESYAPNWQPPNASWQHSLTQGVQFWPGDNSHYAELYAIVDNRLYTFKVLADGSVVPGDQSTSGANLVSVSGQWNLTDKSGNIFVFYAHPGINQNGFSGSPLQVLLQAKYANGTTLNYSYNASAQPRFVTSNSGYALTLDYDANGNVSAVCGFNLAQTYADASTTCSGATLKVSYFYNAAGTLLTSVTDVLAHVVNIAHVALPLNGAQAPSCISLPDSATCEIQNVYGPQPGEVFSTMSDQVRIQTTATGDIWRYQFIPQPDPVDVPVVIGQPRYSRSSITDPQGGSYSAKYDRGHLIIQSAPSGTITFQYADRTYNTSYATTYEYHDNYVALMNNAEGDAEFFGHDNRGNVTVHSYWPKGSGNPIAISNPTYAQCCVMPGNPTPPPGSSTYTQTFLTDTGAVTSGGVVFVWGCGAGPSDAKRCDKPLTRVDANGNQTDYTYDAAHGGVLTETLPADTAGTRAQTRYSYAQRYAWVKNAGGAYVQAATPVWVITSKSICKSGAASGASCAAGGDEVVTAYDYGPDSGPNNLQLRGIVEDAHGTALRTCYGYDTTGNRIWTTRPLASLGSCP
jgi:YD repeat-containing protein